MTGIPTERTTAGTDLLLAIVALGCVWLVCRCRSHDLWKAKLWASAFAMLFLASGLGSVAHGLIMPTEIKRLLWHPLNLALGLMVALIAVGAIRDGWGERLSRRILPGMLAVGFSFFGVTVVWANTFRAFVVYEMLALFLVVGIYFMLAVRERTSGSILMTVGAMLTIVAAAIQATWTSNFHCMWTFDHNGIFHLVQVVAVACLITGVIAEMCATQKAAAVDCEP
jgi:hypothetical protein